MFNVTPAIKKLLDLLIIKETKKKSHCMNVYKMKKISLKEKKITLHIKIAQLM